MNQKPTNEIAAGFTLIEMAIVTALLLVLIVIAFPQFHEKRTLSSVVQVKSDIYSLVVAQESYFQDFMIYPAEMRPESHVWGRSRADSGLFWLTSPIPYIAEIPFDPFNPLSDESGFEVYQSGGIESGNAMLSCTQCLMTWGIFSTGPVHDVPIISVADTHYTKWNSNRVVSYDPTNGIQSRGAIFQYGGDPFWIGVALGAVNRLHYDAFPNSLDYGLVVDEVDYLHRLPPPLK
ncbi:MAG: prepilin-type N-terminal cleavage/methylation domain-containing protein [Candidatus Omnitrophica bacterium]|nr:prepilin-type N-terminal cleavage/methylation domain-containing protein [Candidatus Omnitrophota bacterium]